MQILDLKVTPIARMEPDMEYHAWLPDGRIMATQGPTLRVFDPKKPARDDGWTIAADLSTHGVRDLSRLAVSPKGDWIAFVGTPAGAR